MNAPGTEDNLYGNVPPPPPVPPGPSLLDQVTGVFTDPAALFRRLEATPVWGGALSLLFVVSTAATLIWALRVDVDAMLRPMFERDSRIPAESIDRIIAVQQRLMLPSAVLGGVLALTIICLLMAFIYWLVGKGTAEGQTPSYKVAFSATVVSSLVLVPKFILLAIVAALRNLGGTRLDALSPTSLGFYLAPDSPKLQALYNNIDLFTFASLVMVYLATRHALRLKPIGAFLCVAIAVVFTFGFPTLFAR